jgi:hypothetical protein
MTATLPPGRFHTSAVWDGTNAYVFGGCAAGACPSNLIVRYNPSTNTVTTMSATLPTGRGDTSAVWDGTNAYVFGGHDGSGLNQIVRYSLLPGAPQDLQASAGPGPAEVRLTWQPPPTDTYVVLTSYAVYRGTSPNPTALLATVNGETTSYTDDWLPDVSWAAAGNTYYYRVTAVDDNGESAASNEVTCKPANTLLPPFAHCAT